jgi:CRP/FNR family transcriptional regulator
VSLPDDRWQIVRFALPGDCLGFAIDGRHELSATAVSDVSICRFSSTAFGEFIKAQPHLLRRLHENVEHELNSAQDHMVLLSRFSARRKLAAFLVKMSNRWRRMNGVSAHVPLPMSRRDIAAYLGLTIETVSRTMSLFARQKLIVIVPDGVRLLDNDRLAEVAGE